MNQLDNNFFIRYWLLFLMLLPGFTSLYAQDAITCLRADTLLATDYTAKANTFFKYGYYDSAAVYHRKAGYEYEKLSLWRKCVRSINNASLALIYNSKYDTAKYYLSYSSLIAKKNFSNKAPYDLYCLYEIFVNYGRLYNSLENHDEAIFNFNKCIEIINQIEEFGLTVNFDKLSVYNYLGLIFDTKRDFRKAYHYYNECLVLSKDLYGEKGLNVAILMRNIGGLFYDLDDYSKAHGYYLKALNIFRDNNVETLEEGYLFNDLGLIFQETGNIDEAIKYYQDANAVYTKLLKKEAYMFGELYHNFAEVYSRKYEFKKALEYYNKAIKIFIKHASEVSGYVAHEYNSIGILYLRKNELDSAGYYFKKSLRYRKKIYGDIHPGVAESYYNIGLVCFNKSDYAEAISFFNSSLKSEFPEFRPAKLHDNPDVDTLKYLNIGIFSVLSKKAEALYSLYKEQTKFYDDIIASSNTFDLAFKVSDITKNEYSAEESKLIHGEKLKVFYENAISINLEIAKFDPDYYNKVFEYIEKSKAAQLFFQLKDLNARNIAGIPDSLLLKEKIIKKNLAYVNTMIQKIKQNNTFDSVKLLDYENKHFDLTMESDSLINLFETNYPKYKAIKYSLNYPTIKEIQNKLDVNSALVEYFTGDSVLYTVLISVDTFLVFNTTTGSNFHKKISDYVQSIKCFDINKFYAESSRLFELLIKPVYKFIIDKNQLIIIPDEYLNSIPFESLITKRVKNKDYFFDLSLADFLIKKFNIVYNYSSFLWLNSKNPNLNRETGEGFLGMAPVFSEQNGYIKDNYFSPFDSLQKQMCLRHITRAGKEFNVLPYTEIEVNSIIDLFELANLPAKGYFIKDATEEAFINNCNDYKYIHIATHGFVNEKYPGVSGLAFSQIKQTDTIKNNQLLSNDGILFLNEIYNLEINADLVVLSACETGVGKLVRGEGLMAITRGFVYSGVPNIVFSLWNISDKYTKDLMVEFYKDILSGMDYPTSLRNAKLKLINNEITSHPYYWSGFLLMGN